MGKYKKQSGKTFYTPRNKYFRDFTQKIVHGGRVVALNRKFVSTSFNQIVNILKKYFGKEHEISTLFEIYFRQINKVKKHYTRKYENKFDENRKINKQHFENYIKKKLSSLPISKELNNINKSDLLVSGDYDILYPSAMAHEKSTWPAIETANAINPEDSEVYCKLFNTGEWASLNKTGFFEVKYHNPENLILQHMAVKEDVYNEAKNKSEKVNRFRNGDIKQHLTSVNIEEVVKVGGVIEELYEGFICDNLDYNQFKEYMLDMTARRNEYRKQGKNILQDMCKKISNGTYGGCIRCDIYDVLKCVSENWMKTEYDDRVKEYIPLKDGNYLVNVKDHDGVDDNGVSKKVNSQPFQFGSLILLHSKRLMNDVILALDGFKNNKIYSGDRDSVSIQKNDYNMFKENS